MVQQKQHLHLCQAPPQALAHAKAKGQVWEPGTRGSAVQPALGLIALGPGEHGGVSTQGVQEHLHQCLQTGGEGQGQMPCG